MKNQKVINFFWIAGSLILFIRFFILLKEMFFFHDEWTFLYKSITDPVNFLFSSHNGHFIPLFNLIYLICYRLFRLNYVPYQFILLAFHFINAYLLYLIIFLFTKRKILGVISFFLFLITPMYWEVLFSFSTMPTILCLTFMELAIYFLIKYRQQKKTKCLLLSAIFSFFSSISWGAGVFFPFLLLILVLENVCNKRAKLLGIMIYLFFGLSSSLIYFLFTKPSSGLTLDFEKVLKFTLTATRWGIVSFYTSSPGLLKIFMLVVLFFLISGFIALKGEINRKKILRGLLEYKFVLFFLIVCFVYIYVLSAVSRYQIDMELAKSSRYTYVPLFFFLSINMLVFNVFASFFSKIIKSLFFVYFLFLVISGTYFFNIYYRNWTETISNPNKKIFMRIIQSKSERERKEIKIPTTFHDFYGPEKIFQIYRRTYPEKNILSLDLEK